MTLQLQVSMVSPKTKSLCAQQTCVTSCSWIVTLFGHFLLFVSFLLAVTPSQGWILFVSEQLLLGGLGCNSWQSEKSLVSSSCRNCQTSANGARLHLIVTRHLSQPQSIQQKGVHARPLTARERTLVFAAFEQFPSHEFRASIARTPFCAILWRSPTIALQTQVRLYHVRKFLQCYVIFKQEQMMKTLPKHSMITTLIKTQDQWACNDFIALGKSYTYNNCAGIILGVITVAQCNEGLPSQKKSSASSLCNNLAKGWNWCCSCSSFLPEVFAQCFVVFFAHLYGHSDLSSGFLTLVSTALVLPASQFTMCDPWFTLLWYYFAPPERLQNFLVLFLGL